MDAAGYNTVQLNACGGTFLFLQDTALKAGLTKAAIQPTTLNSHCKSKEYLYFCALF